MIAQKTGQIILTLLGATGRILNQFQIWKLNGAQTAHHGNEIGAIMAELVGNLLVGQSGGPTAVINASLAGVIQEAGKHECIEEIYGGLNGILGMLN